MKGRIALVTGGASGIGRAICQTLAARGARVAVADLQIDKARELVAELEARGEGAVALEVDVTSSDSVSAGFAGVREAWGDPEILVNCAGWDELKPFLATDEAFWDRVIEINFKGALRTMHAALPAMLDASWGRVVNIGSDAGRVGSSLEAVYSGAKGGVIALSKTIAREVARKGVTVNTVCPGPTATPLLQGIVDQSESGDKVIQAMTRAVPMKRLGEPEEVAAAVAFLASDEAAFVTGQTLSVSGGLTMA